MIDEEVLASCATGFLLGLFAFAAGIVRVRYWASRRRQSPLNPSSGKGDARYFPAGVAQSSGGKLRVALNQYLALERLIDLLALGFVIAMLLYGAWVAPKLRLILAVAVVTGIGCSLVWVKTKKWLVQRRQ